MASFTEFLERTAERTGSIVCLGMDPVVEKIPLKGSTGSKIVKFYTEILSEIGNSIGAVKPNYAFFAQYGFEGLKALENVILAARKYKLPIILDAKRGDIGTSSEAYSKEVFEAWKADAVTVSPYMGSDSVSPFIQWCSLGKGVYVLVRTSNPGAADFQQQTTASGKKLFMTVAGKVVEWHKSGVGAVVGATNSGELGTIAEFFTNTGKKIPLLIPGVGAQGGEASDVAEVLRKSGSNMKMHRINSSRGICYAFEKDGSNDYVSSAEKAVKELNKEIGKLV